MGVNGNFKSQTPLGVKGGNAPLRGGVIEAAHREGSGMKREDLARKKLTSAIRADVARE